MDTFYQFNCVEKNIIITKFFWFWFSRKEKETQKDTYTHEGVGDNVRVTQSMMATVPEVF